MRLAYHVPDKLWWIHDFLPFHFYKDLHSGIIKQRKKVKFHSVKGVWKEDLITNLEAPYRLGVENYKPFDELKILIRHNPFFRLECEKMTTTIHSMRKGAGINWHNDDNYKYGATYYVNRRWGEQWGGEFLSRNKDLNC